MVIVLDTNVFQEDYSLRSSRFEILFDYVSKTEARFAMPKIVADELRANFRRELQSRFHKWVRARQQLGGLGIEIEIPSVELDPDEASDKFVARVLHKLGVSEERIVPYGEDYLEDVVQRAIQRRPPCTDRGEEMRDALLWKAALDIARSSGESVVLISKNTKQFAGENQELHSALREEARAEGLEVIYLPSLEEFARLHATSIAFITREWLQEEIGGDGVFESAIDGIIYSADHIAKRSPRFNERVLGGYFIESGYAELDEFYVYEMSSGEFRIESTWIGSAEVEYNIEVEADDPWDWDTEIDSDYRYYPGPRYPDRNRKRKILELDITIRVEAVIKDEGVESWEMIESLADLS